MNYELQNEELSALIVEGSGPNLIGRHWLNKVKLDWKKLFKIHAKQKEKSGQSGGNKT